MKLTVALICFVTSSVSTIAQQPAPLATLDPRIFDSYLGSYQLPAGRLVVIARSERRLYAYEPGNERFKGLDRVDDSTWTAGPSLLVYKPESYRLTFHKTRSGEV